MPTSSFNATRGCYLDANDTDKHYSSNGLYVKSTAARRGLLEFDVTPLPSGVSVDSATLSLKVVGYFGSNPAGRTYHLNRATRTDWVTTADGNPASGGATWSHVDYPTTAWTAPGGDYTTTDRVAFVVPAVGSRVQIDVTALVARANRNNVLSLLILDPVSGTNHQAVLGGPADVEVDRPSLSVTYSSSTPPTSVIFGAAITPHTQARWNQVTNLLGPLSMPRAFKSSLPTTYENGEWAWHDNAGLTGLISVKPDVTATINGTNHNAIRDFAATVPDGTWITAWHEPENDSPLQDGKFVAMLENFYNAVKDGNPTLLVGYAAMAYQWGSGQASTSDPSDWTPVKNFVDWVGADVYSYDWSGPNDSLYEHQEFQRWWTHFGDFAGPKGIIERGISQFATGGTRAGVLERDLEFVAEHGLALYLYWNANANANRPEVWVMDNDPQACAVMQSATGA